VADRTGVTRREALTLGSLTLGGGALLATGCQGVGQWIAGEAAVSARTVKNEPGARLLNRFGYGPRPGDLERITQDGEEAWIKEQLQPGEEDLATRTRIETMAIYRLSPYDLRDWPENRVVDMLQDAVIIRAVNSPWTLRERMVGFWMDHLNVYARKGIAAYRLPHYERDVIRAHAMGSFHDLIRASAHHSAMLVYLDQQNSTAAQPNENYARELMELHTLGVYGGYTQTDVMEVARCFTGWVEERDMLRPKGKVKFVESLHDDGEKRVLGVTIPAGGKQKDGERVLDIVLEHPATARHIAGKLAYLFTGEEKDSLVAKLESQYKATKGDIPTMIKTIYDEGSWREASAVGKRPFDYVVSSLRALDVDCDGGAPLRNALRRMGQPTWEWPMPDGYPTETEAWQGSLLARWNFAYELAGGMKGAGKPVDQTKRWDGDVAEQAVQAVFHRTSQSLGADDLMSVLRGIPDLDPRRALALALASPEYQWK